MFITFTLWATLIKYIRKTYTLTKNHKLTDSQTHDLYTLQTHDLYTLQTQDLYTLQTQDLYVYLFPISQQYLKGSEDNYQVLVDINKLHTLLVL